MKKVLASIKVFCAFALWLALSLLIALTLLGVVLSNFDIVGGQIILTIPVVVVAILTSYLDERWSTRSLLLIGASLYALSWIVNNLVDEDAGALLYFLSIFLYLSGFSVSLVGERKYRKLERC